MFVVVDSIVLQLSIGVVEHWKFSIVELLLYSCEEASCGLMRKMCGSALVSVRGEFSLTPTQKLSGLTSTLMLSCSL